MVGGGVGLIDSMSVGLYDRWLYYRWDDIHPWIWYGLSWMFHG